MSKYSVSIEFTEDDFAVCDSVFNDLDEIVGLETIEIDLWAKIIAAYETLLNIPGYKAGDS
jgi:hypothetical protein